MKKTKNGKVTILVVCVVALACLACVAWAHRGTTLYYRYVGSGEEVFKPTRFTNLRTIPIKDKEGYRFNIRKDLSDETYTAWYYEEPKNDEQLTVYAVMLDNDGELVEIRSIDEMPTDKPSGTPNPNPKPDKKPDQRPENMVSGASAKNTDKRPPKAEIPDGPTVSNP